MPLRDEVIGTLNALCEGKGVTVDEDGDICVDVGDGLVWVRVLADPDTVSIFRPVACDVPRTSEVDEFLHDTSAQYVIFRAFWESECIVLRADLPACPFVPRQLQVALDAFDVVAADVEPAAQAWSRS